jgi:phosphohistidine phosphatase
MSRTLVIMRHAKAEQPGSAADIDRPLTTRGRADARAAGVWLGLHRIAPELVLCSPSTRTRSTWHEVAIGFSDGPVAAYPNVRYENDLYYSGVNAVLALIRAVEADVGTVLVIGHNPTVSALSQRLDDAAGRASAGLKTSGIAVHSVPTEWPDLAVAPVTALHTARA